VKIFKTSIFDYWSLISAYSYGLSQLSPNREFFRNRLKMFAEKTNADALLLLNENGIILSSYSNDINFEKVFEISAPHFQTLYKTFNEFKLLKKDYIISSGMKTDTKNIVFKKVKVDKRPFVVPSVRLSEELCLELGVPSYVEETEVNYFQYFQACINLLQRRGLLTKIHRVEMLEGVDFDTVAIPPPI